MTIQVVWWATKTVSASTAACDAIVRSKFGSCTVCLLCCCPDLTNLTTLKSFSAHISNYTLCMYLYCLNVSSN
ncbi:hypothetical protein T01_8393 [Trichinella spiralis]|uniref:Uncharacterized protein n=1 Tax=Trichinella spiralis TaxID=6334 RepID=A0A0V1BIV2_TRISP|nr:hypothetical protein T01_8393 [Trichinella spiralis]